MPTFLSLVLILFSFIFSSCLESNTRVGNVGDTTVVDVLVIDTTDTVTVVDTTSVDTITVDVITADTTITCYTGKCLVITGDYMFLGRIAPAGEPIPGGATDFVTCPRKKCQTFEGQPGEVGRFTVVSRQTGEAGAIEPYDCQPPEEGATMFGCPCSHVVDESMFLGPTPEEFGCTRVCYVADGTSYWTCNF